MTANLFTVLAVLAVLFFWSRAVLRFRDRIISVGELVFWSAIWIGALAVITQPAVTGVFATKLGIGRGSDAVVYASIIVLFYLLFRIYIKIDILKREITSLVQALAIEQARKSPDAKK